ncbi:MAG: Crp/Fnr family transcriptional regulator [Rhodospirillales bacterium]
MLSETDIAVLARTRLLGRVDRAVLASLVGPGTVRTYDKGQTVFRKGDPARHIFVVLEGWVKIYRDTPQGEEAVLGVFGPGETFAEAAAFLTGVYPASAEAVESTRLCAIAHERLRSEIKADPDIAMSMLGAMAWHLHGMVNDLERLKTRNAPQRIGIFLLEMCVNQDSPCTVYLPYEKSLIAARLGMTPESLSRSFSRLAEVGVRLEGHRVEIEDRRRLEAHCQFESRKRPARDRTR